MPLLYYWRGDNYRQDLELGVGFHLNQANPLLHAVELGDSVWALPSWCEAARAGLLRRLFRL